MTTTESKLWSWSQSTTLGTRATNPKGSRTSARVRPLRGEICGYLDDLFVDAAVRGAGAVDALFAEINQIAVDRNWPLIRWTTADDNYRARSVYDERATRTTWITYDMVPTGH